MHDTHPHAHPALAEIQALFDRRGHLVYGEAITQTDHALQCATLAEQAQARPSLILAAWLHDIGHLQHQDAAAAVAEGRDDAHEALGAKFLHRWFGPEVSEPVRLHVAAKRYLCSVDPSYVNSLSPLSQRTLAIQGGPMGPAEAAAFAQNPFCDDAVKLRRWDDTGKQPGQTTAPQAHFMAMAGHFLQRG